MAKELYFDHRGALTGLTAEGSTLIFTTTHPEGVPTAVYRVDVNTGKFSASDLPVGASGLAADADNIYIAGADHRIYTGGLLSGALTPSGEPFADPIAALAPVHGGLAVLAGRALHIVASNAEPQRFELPAVGRSIAVDPSGRWIAVGTDRGHVAIFEAEEKDHFVAAESARLHEGAVSALCFERDVLEVLSGGVDAQLLVTHARGALDGRDRAGRQGHDRAVQAIMHLGERTYTGSKDGQVKSWTSGSRRPQTVKLGGRALAFAAVNYKERAHLAVAGEDGKIRLLQLDGQGKPVLGVVTILNAYLRAEHAFQQREPQRRQKALRVLAAFNDQTALGQIAERATADADHAVRVEACTLLGQSGNPHAVPHLEGLLNARTADVRLAALTGLRALRGEADQESLDQALATSHADLGKAAIAALVSLATQNDDAHVRLVNALDHRTREVRFAALTALESLVEARDPLPSLTALKSTHADLRGHALLRCYQRELLDDDRVQAALRTRGEDSDANVRLMAFQIAVLARPVLAEALRARDATLHRQLHALQHHGADKEPKLPKTRKGKVDKVTAADRRPLIEAMASRALDTCVRGAVALAAIQDPRAFGTLLQLSRERDTGTRVAACRALADQGDARGIARLRQMLRDGEAAVRDAAYSALVTLMAKAPIDAIEAGLMATHEDVRRRGLKRLVAALKKAPKKKAAIALLTRALNDSASAVRTEAFKTALNLPVGGDAESALRFVLQSLHADVRREVLTEAMGEVKQAWAWRLLLDLFDDPDATVRREAFDFAKKKGRGRTPDPLAHALTVARTDMRLAAVQALATKRNADARALLIGVLDDAEPEVRQTALDALTGDADALAQAMQSSHPDVRIKAAAVRARAGDAAAAAPLMAQLNETEPDVADRAQRWQARVVQALNGLAELGHAPAAPLAAALLDSPKTELRRAAAHALAWISTDPAPLLAALRHSDAEVKQAAALGLAWLGDPSGMAILAPPPPPPSQHTRRGRHKKRATPTPKGAPADAALFAALALGDRDRILAALDHADSTFRRLALRLILLIEWREGDALPDWCLAALSAQSPWVRLAAAQALEHFGDPAAFEAFVVQHLNGRDRDADWNIDANTWRRLADAIALGTGRFRVRAARLLTALDGEQALFEQRWQVFDQRFGDTLDALEGGMPAVDETGLDAVVFGTYVGLSRSGSHRDATVRLTALNRLAAIVGAADAVDWHAIAPVMLQALLDNAAIVRQAAFDHLAALDYPRAALAAEALGTGQRDVGVRGLEMLAQDAGAEGEAVLARVLTTYTDGLEHEAARLLTERIGLIGAMQAGFEAQSSTRRGQSVATLAGRDDARDALIAALESRFADVRAAATFALARQNDAAAFEPLVTLLNAPGDRYRRDAIRALSRLDDARAPDALLDRLDTLKPDTDAGNDLLAAVGNTRRVAAAERVFARLEAEKNVNAAFRAALSLSGYDQYLGDPDDEADWLPDQHPRHDALLVRLLQIAHGQGHAWQARDLIAGARWAKSASVQPALEAFAAFKDDRVRREAVEALAWRAEERDGGVDALLAAVNHDDPTTAFLAAEGLAHQQRTEGVSVLLSAIELGDSVEHRGRAVRALGVLADPRAIDTLLELAANDEHALQQAAAEAIGHLAQTEQAERAFEILDALAQRDWGDVPQNALTGLRYFNTPSAWKRVLSRAEDDGWAIRERVAELLAHHDHADARATLLDRIRKDDDWDVVHAAVRSLRTLDGPDGLDADYALLENDVGYEETPFVERIAEKGTAERIFAALPKVHADATEEYVDPLIDALLARDPLPIEAAAAALSNVDHRIGQVAARIIGQAGQAASAHAEGLTVALQSSLAAWRTEADIRRGSETLTAITERLRQQIWAANRLHTGDALLLDAARLDGASAVGRPVRAAAIEALADGRGGDDGLTLLRTIATGHDAALRALAASALADRAPDVATALLPQTLSDRPTLDRLVRGVDHAAAQAVLRDAAQQAHAQGAVLPHLIAQGDAAGLATVATDADQDLTVRVGAIEALARIATEPAQAALIEVGKSATDDALQKSAWRALRRAKRQARREVRA